MLRTSRIDRAGSLPAALLFLALLLRALVPAGFMIGTAASGAPALMLCPGVETPPAVHPMAMRHGMAAHRHDPAMHRDAPCPFAAFAAPALPSDPPAVALPPAPPLHLAAPASFRAAATASLAAPPPPATGPPASA